MRRRQVISGLIAAPSALALSGSAIAQARPAKLAEQVRALVERYAAAWNAPDMAAMRALYTPEVHWVNVVGMHWQGRDDVDYAHRVLFEESFRGVPNTLEEVESVTPIDGGGAVAVVRWAVGAYRSPAGHTFPAGRTRMSLVLLPRDGKLLIAHGANIQIVEPAQRSDPIVRRRASGS